MVELYKYIYSILDILIMLFFGSWPVVYSPIFHSVWAGANGGEIQICNEE